MQKITDPKKIKDFVVATIRTGNKERIQKVLNRYFQFQKEQQRDNINDLVEEAKRIFSNGN